MTELVSDEALHATAILERINAALPTSYRAMELDEIERSDPRPEAYTEVVVEARAGGNLRAGATSTGGWRFQTRGVSHSSKVDARRQLTIARQALQFTCLEIGGKQTTPIQLESAEAVGKDDGWWSGSITWTYAL